MQRTARIVVPDVSHHITQRGNNRQDVFFIDDDRRVVFVHPQGAIGTIRPGDLGVVSDDQSYSPARHTSDERWHFKNDAAYQAPLCVIFQLCL